MKLSAVYKSARKVDTYLYVAKRDDFSQVPEFLMKQFGTPKFVMLLAMTKHNKIAGVDKQKIIEKLQEQGFYLQLPPKPKSMLEAHLASQKTSQKAKTNGE